MYFVWQPGLSEVQILSLLLKELNSKIGLIKGVRMIKGVSPTP